MAKTVEDVTRALKLKAEPKDQVLSIRIGVRKHTLPFEVRTLQSDEYVFVHIPPAASILKVTDKGLVPVESLDEAAKAQVKFRKPRTRSAAKSTSKVVELPSELEQALRKIPSGHKLVFDAAGNPRIVRSRKRRAKK